MSNFKENTNLEICSSIKQQYSNFIGFILQIIEFYGYFNDLTKSWHIITSYDVINVVILCWILRKTQILEIFSPRKTQYIDFIGFPPQIIYFYCYFDDLTKFWPIMTSHDVINDVILSRISRKAQNMEICSPRKPQYIDFIHFPSQIIYCYGYFNDLTKFWPIMT